MKVLFDISTLGLGQFMPRARTGVFRVVEQTALGLVRSGACEVAFTVSEGDVLQCHEYLKTSPLFAGYRSCPALGPLLTLSGWLTRFPAERARPYAFYAVETLLKTVLRQNLVFSESPFVAPDRAAIYHSPFYAIPGWVDYGRLKVFLTVHDLIPIIHPEYFRKFRKDQSVIKALTKLGCDTNIICVSQSTKNDLCNYLKLDDISKISVVPLAASENFYNCTDRNRKIFTRYKYNIPDDANYFLSLSTFEPRKNIETTINSFVRLLHDGRMKDLYLVLTGSKGWDYQQIFSKIRSAADFRARIILTGYVPDEDLAPLYSDALAFVYPSYYEGFGLPPLEAMQCGTPVIASNSSSLPEVIGDAGIMMNPSDEDAMCQAMLNVYRDADLRHSMQEKSLARASLFSWDRYTNELIALYKKALSG